jgi:RNA polymerase sigma-70 factor (ECF subfamily)
LLQKNVKESATCPVWAQSFGVVVLNEGELIDRSRDGDQQAFRLLVEKYQRLVAHVVFRLVPDVNDRDDVCQDVFVRVYRHLGKFKRQARFSTWIATIAYNTAASFLRRRRTPPLDNAIDADDFLDDLPSATPGPEDQTEDNNLAEILRREIEKLPAEYRVSVTLYHLEELKYEEIAHVMRVPIGTIKSYLFRARRILKERLSARYDREEIWR